MATPPGKVKNILFNLGKPTLRGVRKCPKCGTLNGTRGISCKNKGCDMVFKEKDRKRGHSAEAVKIITGSSWRVYSVRLRDRGPDYRGFVQLPLVQDMDGNPAENVDADVLAGAARCYVDPCGSKTGPCNHIRAAIECDKAALPLTLKNSVLNSLALLPDVKQSLWMLATETTGPLVQRVTKDIMVVKCQVSVKTPLGFLHCSFFENRSIDNRFQCSCRTAFKSKSGTVKGLGVKEESPKRCIHYYACICALASDDKLAHEFATYIELDNPFTKVDADTLMLETSADDDEQTTSLMSSADMQPEDVMTSELTVSDQNLEVMIIEDGVGLLLESDAKRSRTLDPTESILETHVEVLPEDIVTSVATEAVTLPSGIEAQASSALLTLQAAAHQPKEPETPKKPLPNILKTSAKTATPVKKQAPVENEGLSLTFNEWLGSVTERVNQTMHYQFDGNPDPLVFHSPQKFFDILQHRISTGNRKRRLPNSTTGFIRKDALPLGTFTKYTWHITNILHVKQIFDTPGMPLRITRSFVENRDGTYDSYEPPFLQSVNDGTKNITPIRPFELKTYLKVGNTARDQTEPTPFIIEWIPDILPHSRIGELRIKFEYGHERNGQIEHRTQSVSATVVAL